MSLGGKSGRYVEYYVRDSTCGDMPCSAEWVRRRPVHACVDHILIYDCVLNFWSLLKFLIMPRGAHVQNCHFLMNWWRCWRDQQFEIYLYLDSSSSLFNDISWLCIPLMYSRIVRWEQSILTKSEPWPLGTVNSFGWRLCVVGEKHTHAPACLIS